MPNPRSDEDRAEWLERCMGDPESIDTYPESDQRYAVCIAKWEDKAEGYKPTEAMADEAKRGLEWRAEYNRGGTEVGVARARDISNRRNLSSETVARMRSYFARHEVDKQGQGWSPGEDGYPSAGRIAWALWGGDPGRSWAEKIGRQEGEKTTMTDDNKADAKFYTKAVALDLKREPDQDGIFEGYASVFNVVDQGMDVVERGAFRKSLGTRRVKMLWQHDQSQPIGVWDVIEEDERGLYVRGRLLKEIEKGREAMALLKAGAIDSMSIGYRTIESAPEGDGMVRRLKEIDLYEISLVTFPMLPDAKVTAVKSIKTERDFEKFLRDAGFSRRQATALALHGYKAINRDERDASSDEANASAKALLEQLQKLKDVIQNG